MPTLISTSSIIASQQSSLPLVAQKTRFNIHNEKKKSLINDDTKSYDYNNSLSNKTEKVNDKKKENAAILLLKENKKVIDKSAINNRKNTTDKCVKQSDENKNQLITMNLNNLKINENSEQNKKNLFIKNDCKQPLTEQISNNSSLHENNKESHQWSTPPSPPSHPPPSSSTDSAEDEEDSTVFSISSDSTPAITKGIKKKSNEFFKESIDTQKQLEKKSKDFFKFILDDRLETS